MQTVNLLTIKDKKFDIRFILAILNSKLMDFYYQNSYNIGSEFTTAISVTNLRRLSIKYTKNQKPFIILSDYMTVLCSMKNRENETIDFIDNIIDTLVFELYFKDQLKTNLIELIDYNIKNIENMEFGKKIR